MCEGAARGRSPRRVDQVDGFATRSASTTTDGRLFIRRSLGCRSRRSRQYTDSPPARWWLASWRVGRSPRICLAHHDTGDGGGVRWRAPLAHLRCTRRASRRSGPSASSACRWRSPPTQLVSRSTVSPASQMYPPAAVPATPRKREGLHGEQCPRAGICRQGRTAVDALILRCGYRRSRHRLRVGGACLAVVKDSVVVHDAPAPQLRRP
jgi:hypothetical protein